MKRWIWLLVMAPVMWGLFDLVCWADTLHAWQYSPEFDPPTDADRTRAFLVFWGALLTPVIIGLAAAIVSFRRHHVAHWPWAEMAAVGLPWVVFLTSLFFPFRGQGPWERVVVSVIFAANLLMGGVVVMVCQNAGACIRQRKWGRLGVSAIPFLGGMIYLCWLYAFIIYVDT